ncbi:MAG: TM0106 family RecB-like putative nuclease [Gaiellaceae bacterium]
MRQRDNRILFSPTDLTAFLECEHLTQLQLAVARREIARPAAENPQADLVKRKGAEHEHAYLEQLLADGRKVVTIPNDWDLDAAARATEEAMRVGAEVVYQACFVEGSWRGFADFVERQPDGGYEVVDTKLARNSKPAYVLQLCFYSEQVARVQGSMPGRMHVVLGTRERSTLRVADFLAYYRRVRRRFVRAVEAGIDVYPLPVSFCPRCDFQQRCEARWRKDDHLSLVAGMRRDQIRRLERRGIATVASFAHASDDARPPAMAPRTYETLRDQAAMQTAARTEGHVWRVLEPEPGRGFELLPPPSGGDLFFDIEGDPFWEPARGLEYLWGIVDTAGTFRPFWAHDRLQERRAVEAVIDLLRAGHAADPAMHVYHYAAYEVTALKRLTCEYGTREEELDELLRDEIFVDLYTVVSQGLRLSHERYGLKQVETFYFERQAGLRAGDDSIVLYEEWLDRHDPRILDEIAAYNEEDCTSTLRLRDWLLALRPGAAPPAEPREPREPTEGAIETEELRAALLAGVPEDPHEVAEADRPRRLLAQLLLYHRREEKPVWWAFFAKLGRTSEELQERDSAAIGGLEQAGPPVGSAHSLIWPFTFPAQQHHLGVGDHVFDPATGRPAGKIESLDEEAGLLALRRGPKFEEVPLPAALIPGGPYDTKVHQAALRRLARSVLAGDEAYLACKSVLVREPFPSPLPQDDLEAAKELVAGLGGRHLVIQGPPGSGKTYTGARLIVHLMRLGRRVGVAATSHKSIHNLVGEVEQAASEQGFAFRGLKKGDSYESDFVTTSENHALFSMPEDDLLLLAGTAWLFARPEMEEAGIDTLFVDEAGQIALADALALATCARNVVLLGDPQQLGQVSQGKHPAGASASVLEHLLAGEDTVAADRGLFLSRTWRMHPDVCRFISETSYDGRLHSVPACERQRIDSSGLTGTGLRWLPVEHRGNRASSIEEADRVAAELELLIGGTFTDCEGRTRQLGWDDVLVVTPYNAQVRCLSRRLGRRARIGTVDKFQGQEAPVVFFSMATSSGEDLPRNLEFLFSRNRLNVAVSRAQSLAALVASPRLLEIRCSTIEQMRMVNALCRFVDEAAEPVSCPLPLRALGTT